MLLPKLKKKKTNKQETSYKEKKNACFQKQNDTVPYTQTQKL